MLKIQISPDLMPSFTPPGIYVAEIEASLKKGKANFVHLMTFRWYGEVVRN